MTPELIKSYTAGAAISKNRIVKFDSSDGVVIQGAAATDLLIGVSVDSLEVAAGEKADIIHSGIAYVQLGGTVTRGGLITSDATGQGVAAAPGAGVNNAVIGRALQSGVTQDIILVHVVPQQIQG